MGSWKEGLQRLVAHGEHTRPRGVRCGDCGYALVSLPVGNVCPECGSAETTLTGDSTLQDADAGYLRCVATGIVLATAAVWTGAAVVIGAGVLLATPWDWLLDSYGQGIAQVGCGIAGVLGLGVRMIGVRDSAGATPVRGMALPVSQYASVLGVGAAAVVAVLLALDGDRELQAVMVCVAAGLLGAACLGVMSLGASMAARAGDERLARDFEVMRWALAPLGILGAAAFFGPFVAAGVWCWLLLRLRVRVNEALRAAAGE